MLATLEYVSKGRNYVTTQDLPDTEQGFWHVVASVLQRVDIPSVYLIKTQLGDAALDVKQRGTFVLEGEECPSMFIVPMYNNIPLAPDAYEDAYLTCINPDSRGGMGNYKFYRLSQKPDKSITAFYGRIGQTSGFGAEREIKEPIPSWMFEIRKAEKMTKGYIDRSATYCESNAHEATPVGHAAAGDNLYRKLLAFASHFVTNSLAAGTIVTDAQVEEGYKLLSRISRCRKVESFNERLLELMSIAPRNLSSVKDALARNADDFERIIDREESLLAAMSAVAKANARSGKSAERDGFIENGISWNAVSGSEYDKAMSYVPRRLRSRVRNVYRVDPTKQHSRFIDYLGKRGLDGSDVKLMWHGSRNENWCSIISRSLMLNPTAKITGKMFGYGIYFGYDEVGGGANKSWNYTSAHGSRWANGSSDTAFMGLYEVAYGTPYNPHGASSFNQKWLDSRGYDCVHARGGDCGLMYDEVVFYDEAAVCIKYLFEFNA